MDSYAKPKLQSIFLDSELNDDLQVLSINIYQNAILVAIKSHVYLKELRKVAGAIIRPDLLFSIILKFSRSVERRIKKHCSSPLVTGTSLGRALFYRAFLEMWSRRPSKYKEIMEKLALTCEKNPLKDVLTDETEVAVVKSGEVLFQRIRF